MATSPKLYEIADTLSKLTVLEAKELLKILENDYGITSTEAVTPIIGIPNTGEVVAVEQTEFDVYLKEVGGQKLLVIKKVNESTGLGLKASKELVDSAPCLVREKILKYEADAIKSELESVGAIVEIR